MINYQFGDDFQKNKVLYIKMKKKVINFSDPLIKFEEFNKIVFKVSKKIL